MKNNVPKCVGLIPAAGTADRVSPLPCSKEIFPIGFGEIGHDGRLRPKVTAHYLMEQMTIAGANCVYFVLSKGKWDIPAYFGDGSMVNMSIAYIVTGLPYGVPFTIDSAFPFLEGNTVLFGFADIIVQSDDVYIRLLDQMNMTKADIVLGLFPAVNPQKMDMVVLDTQGAISEIDIKPAQTDLHWTWTIAVWNVNFTRYMHDYVCRELDCITKAASKDGLKHYRERFVGDVIKEAIGSELKIEKVEFPQGKYVDVGTPEDLKTAIRAYAQDF